MVARLSLLQFVSGISTSMLIARVVLRFTVMHEND